MALTKAQGKFSQAINDGADATAITIDSSEKVGIGTTGPNQLLTLGSDTGSATIGLDFETTTVSRGSILYNAGAGEMAFTSGYSGYGGYMTFDCNGAERARILSGGGITFNGDTATANALGDYEEGTWTPAFRTGFSSVTYHATHLSGTYTKIGNTVSCWFYFYLNTSTGNGSAITVEGLPYDQRPNVSSSPVINVRAIGCAGYNTVVSGQTLQFYGEPSTDYFYLYHDGSTESTASGNLTSTFLIGHVSYQAS